jgi:hypothetical protein
VAGAAFVVAMFALRIGFYGPSVFLPTLHATRGWSVTLISAAITNHCVFGAGVIARLAIQLAAGWSFWQDETDPRSAGVARFR